MILHLISYFHICTALFWGYNGHFLYYILDSKRNAYFQYPFHTRNPYHFFTLNDMNMFDRTYSFVPDHLIRHYTNNNYFLLINAKNAKTVPYIGKHSS